MTFWSGEKLGERLPELIDPFDPARIDCAAYRLQVGPEIYVSPTDQAKDAQTKSKVALDPGEAFTVPAGQFAFLLTEERVTVPDTALAFISVRATVKFRGLVNVSGFHVDPGYTGRLVFSVFNAGPGPVHLARGDECFLIWYADLDRPTKLAKAGGGFDNIPTKLINPIAGDIRSLAGLSKRMDAIAAEQTLVRVIGLMLVAVLLGWFIRELTASRSPAPAAQVERPVAESPTSAPEPTTPRSSAPAQPLTPAQPSSITVQPRASQPIPPDRR